MLREPSIKDGKEDAEECSACGQCDSCCDNCCCSFWSWILAILFAIFGFLGILLIFPAKCRVVFFLFSTGGVIVGAVVQRNGFLAELGIQLPGQNYYYEDYGNYIQERYGNTFEHKLYFSEK